MSVKLTLMDKLQKRGWNSPDFSELRLRREILLFIYGGLKKGSWENKKYLEGAKYCGEAYTLSSEFCMKTGVDYPLVFREKVMAHACIKGEAWLVGPQHILQIDELEQNNLYTNRSLERIILLDQNLSTDGAVQGNHYLGFRWSWGFVYVANKEAHQNARLSSRGIRNNKTAANTIRAKPYYEWDLWEGEWPYGQGQPGGAVDMGAIMRQEQNMMPDLWGDHYD